MNMAHPNYGPNVQIPTPVTFSYAPTSREPAEAANTGGTYEKWTGVNTKQTLVESYRGLPV